MTTPRPQRSFGAFWMLLPAAALAMGSALLFQRPGENRDVVPPRVADPDAPVAAQGGRLEGALGSALVARLAPMHADPERQAFETEALGARLELGAGEPWRLSLRWIAGALEDSRGDAGPLLQLGAVSVVDAQGTALTSIPKGTESARPGAAADPVRALLTAPGGTLGPGEAVDWILWGRAPREGAHLVGLLPGGAAGAELDRLAGLGGRFELEPRTVRRSELVLPVARLDRSAPQELETGKTGAGGASEVADEARALDR